MAEVRSYSSGNGGGFLIPSPLSMSCSFHSRPGPVVLTPRDSFLKARSGKEARVDDLQGRGDHAFEAFGHLFRIEGPSCDIITFLHVLDGVFWLP